MRHFLAALVFGTAVAGATLAAGGMVVAPHVDPAGTPAVHDHVLAAYRYPLFLMRLQDRLTPERTRFALGSPLSAGFTGLILALLVIGAPKLSRPTRRAIATLPVRRLEEPQWCPALATAPPRALALHTSLA